MKPATMSTRLRALFLLATTALATPIGLGAGPANHTLDLRDNPVSCGWNNMYPCAAGQICYTSNNFPLCSNAAQQTALAANNQGTYQMFTTTYTINGPIAVTSTYSALVGGPTGGTCNTAAGQHPCNPYLCCAADQWCDNTVGNGQCKALGATGSPGMSPGLPAVTVTVTTMNGVPTTMTMSISNYIAPTSISTITITSSNTYTTTQAFETPVGSSGNSIGGVTAQPQTSGGGLSGGAIAGIVIGVLVGLFILFIVLACLCCKGIFDLIFGKKQKKETETFIHTHHSAHGSHHSNRPPPRRWFGILPGKPDRPDRPEKKEGGISGLLAVGGALAALAVFLGLKRRNDRRREEEKSEYTNSVDYYSDYYTETSASSASSDRRTRNTHRSDGRQSRR